VKFLERRMASWFIAATVLLVAALPALATNLVQNGSFEQTTITGTPAQMNTTNVSNWSTTGYNFLFESGTGQTGPVGLYPGITNIMPASSPDGGNFIAADGAYGTAAITQTITGLVSGTTYLLNFYQAGAQQKNYNGATTDRWSVSLGSQTMLSDLMSNPSHDFQPWTLESMLFTATSTSEVLSFLAVGTPTGVPPFSLLDGVSLVVATPEPTYWALIGLTIGSVIFARRRRPQKGTRVS
jgi:hypothetical protein